MQCAFPVRFVWKGKNVGWIMTLMIILGMTGAIVFTELKDHKDIARQKNAMREGFRSSGRIISIEEKTDKRGRKAYRWCVGVQFEFESMQYVVEHTTNEKPTRSLGSSVVVFVDRKDPWKSTISL